MKCDYLKRVITSTKQDISARLTGEMLYAIDLLVALRIYMEAASGFLCGEEVVFDGLIDLGSKVKKTKEYAGIGVKYFSKAVASPMTKVIQLKRCSRKDGLSLTSVFVNTVEEFNKKIPSLKVLLGDLFFVKLHPLPLFELHNMDSLGVDGALIS